MMGYTFITVCVYDKCTVIECILCFLGGRYVIMKGGGGGGGGGYDTFNIICRKFFLLHVLIVLQLIKLKEHSRALSL